MQTAPGGGFFGSPQGCYCLLFATYLEDSTSTLSSGLGEEKNPLEGFLAGVRKLSESPE